MASRSRRFTPVLLLLSLASCHRSRHEAQSRSEPAGVQGEQRRDSGGTTRSKEDGAGLLAAVEAAEVSGQLRYFDFDEQYRLVQLSAAPKDELSSIADLPPESAGEPKSCADARQLSSSAAKDEFEKHDRDVRGASLVQECIRVLALRTRPYPSLMIARFAPTDFNYNFDKHEYEFKLPRFKMAVGGLGAGGLYQYEGDALNVQILQVDRRLLWVIQPRGPGLLALDAQPNPLLDDSSVRVPLAEVDGRQLNERMKKGGVQIEVAFAPGTFGKTPVAAGLLDTEGSTGLMGKAIAFRVADLEGPDTTWVPLVGDIANFHGARLVKGRNRATGTRSERLRAGMSHSELEYLGQDIRNTHPDHAWPAQQIRIFLRHCLTAKDAAEKGRTRDSCDCLTRTIQDWDDSYKDYLKLESAPEDDSNRQQFDRWEDECLAVYGR